jgi:hypothetical protein
MVSMTGTNEPFENDNAILRFIKREFLINLAVVSFPRKTLFNGTGFL